MRYRIDHVAGVYRLNGGVPEQYDFRKNEWRFSVEAGEEFNEGLSSYEATEEQALEYIEQVKKARAVRT